MCVQPAQQCYAAAVLSCCYSQRQQQQNSRAIATVRTSWCCRRLPMMTYMCNAHCFCNLYCVVQLNDTLSFTSISMPPYHTLLLCTRYQVPGGTHWCKNRSYEYNQLLCTGITYTSNKNSNTAPGTRCTRRVFKPLFLMGSIQI